MSYAELLCRSAGSLLHGASQPEELVEAASSLGLRALAITDRDTVLALPQAWQAAKELDLPLICGATITLHELPPVVVLAESMAGWSALCRMITAGRAHTSKGYASVPLSALLTAPEGLSVLLMDGWTPEQAGPLVDAFGDHLDVALHRTLTPLDAPRTERAAALSRALGRPIVATNNVLFHDPGRRPLADVLTCIRRRTTLDAAGRVLLPNDERYLLPPEVFAHRFRDLPEAVRRTCAIAERCTFRLSELSYRYPREVVPEGHTPMAWLRDQVSGGAAERYPNGVPSKVRAQIEHELAVIEQLDFPSYFLTIHDLVAEARRRGILCQGRGSAANSAVCYVLGITQIDPARSSLLFERFLSVERGEPPDIDVDFEHERREEIIQYLYERYGRHRAAMVSEVIAYRPRSAVRDVGKVFGLSLDQCDRLAKLFGHGSSRPPADADDRLRELGLDPTDPTLRWTLRMAAELVGFPRHLGIHSGGFVISDGPLIDLVPVEPAAMDNRTIIQWDKYAVEALGFVKVDVLALGMLTAIRKGLDLLGDFRGEAITMGDVPAEDPGVYQMFQRADTVGVFQIESRAQQSMLPRLKPACFYDLVVEVAIVRPGPIQGGMVHPYLRRRSGEEPVSYAHPDLEPILSRTLGVPLFQEQVMKMAVVVGGFTPGEADGLRRAMGAWRKRGGLDAWGEKLVAGLRAHGISQAFADAIFAQIQGFGEYGFPESHAASFALLVYVSGWLKHRHPAAFCAALINSQPMGFYAPRTLIADAQRHGVAILPICVQHSAWDCTLEPDPRGAPAVRLGLRLVRGLAEQAASGVVAARKRGPFRSLPDLASRSHAPRHALERLAEADALRSLVGERREALWAVQGLWSDLPLFAGLGRREPEPELPRETRLEGLTAEYQSTGLSIHNHPAAEARKQCQAAGLPALPIGELDAAPAGNRVCVVGLVSSRQRPGTAKGVLFIALEDDTGLANCVVWPRTWEAQRKVLSTARLLVIHGELQRHDGAWSILVHKGEAVTDISVPTARSRDFR